MRWLLLCGMLLGAATSAAAQTYRLNRGDTVDVNVYQDPKLNRQAIIAPDGTISFPLAGTVQAAGRTLRDVETQLRDQLRKNFTGDLDVTVSLGALRAPDPERLGVLPPLLPIVYVTGEVGRPGPIEIRRRTTVMQAIALSGGFGTFAASHRVQVHRRLKGRELVMSFNYKAYEAGIDASGNIELLPGDVLIVPERGLLE